VRALRSGDWKLVRYCDPWSEHPAPDEWELYNLALDPVENINLIVCNGAFPTPVAESLLPAGLTQAQIMAAAKALREELAHQEAALLSPYPGAHPSSRL
jgi:hypothetical protein